MAGSTSERCAWSWRQASKAVRHEFTSISCSLMSLFCIPWSTSSSKFSNDYAPDTPHSRPLLLLRPWKDIKSPSKGRIAGNTAISALKIAGDSLPFPGAKAAVGVAIHVIDMCLQTRNSLDRAEELRYRINMLLFTMVQKLSGQPAKEISEGLKNDIQDFLGELCYIETKLEKVCKQPWLLKALSKEANEQFIDKCLMRLDGYLDRFGLARELENGFSLKRIEDGIEKQNRILQPMIEKMLLGSDHEFHQATQSISQQPRLPPRSQVFYGRDVAVEHLVTKLRAVSENSAEQAFIALGGCGGMGKTCLALAVSEHHSVCDRFGSNRFWVPCVKAGSAALLLDTLYDSLYITKKTGRTLDDIIAELEPPSENPALQPFRLLVMDNFETPWNLEVQEHEEVERVLHSLMSIRRLSILITIRANQLPVERWEMELITALDLGASTRIYTEIYPESKEEGLSELLVSLGHLPLAVTLAARYARTNGATPIELLEAWNHEGANGLTVGDGNDNKITATIKLSVDSPLMRKRPDSLKLLVFLALFPAGVPTTYLHDWLPKSINRLKALSTLNNAALVEQRGETIVVMPVIRTHVLHPEHTPQAILNDTKCHVRRLCCSLLAKHKSHPGDHSYLKDKEFISSQETNFQSILLDATTDPDADMSADVLRALLTLCWHQVWTRPRLELIERVCSLSNRLHTRDSRYVAESLACYGEMCYVLTQLKDAIENYTRAHDEFIVLNEYSAAADCTIKLVESRMHLDPSFSGDLELVQRARSEYGSDNAFGEALCLMYTGKVHWQKSLEGGEVDERLSDALSALKKAKKKFEHLGSRFELAHCLYFLCRAHHQMVLSKQPRRDNNTDETEPSADLNLSMALRYASDASNLYKECGYGEYFGRGLIALSNILENQRLYDQALQIAYQALDHWKALGSPFGVAQALHRCGGALFVMGQYASALDVTQKALAFYADIDQDSFVKRIFVGRCETQRVEIERHLRSQIRR
ncbi:hypothetical protein K435DRAFT_959632 [Dendrothele bispora CBS 962.96]|uniref:Novel STAND NTPase 1 domain-containing protein n=1 Tax=Dendrothele bispora (strain CBS 962.96) TaxID=1314807 RepID=A0A4S8MWK7_DENBC|nr:hypothetical protein K435DRAFT_959632 [Dendrothele bispora CBS 962.96]